jgi:hypothetical protein
MKKTAWLCMGFLLLAGSVSAAGFRVGLKGSLFSSEDSFFRDFYGSGAKFGLEAGKDVTESISIWVGLDHLKSSGEMTETKEKTEVWITPLTLGVRYEVPAGEKLRFHLAAGVQEVFFKEKAPAGLVKENALGIVFKGGGMVKLTDNLNAGLFLAWSTCKMTHEDVEFKVGGMDLGIGVDFRF